MFVLSEKRLQEASFGFNMCQQLIKMQIFLLKVVSLRLRFAILKSKLHVVPPPFNLRGGVNLCMIDGAPIWKDRDFRTTSSKLSGNSTDHS
ncbi:hypothetical protein LIER_39775 [Lithospermum erythrorhizon]|uniref:Uncharacterized protein n=1 Tax=Lithospermum erythrorhizon TaxID=34254 RepID=A0AAV3QLL9_LITER